MAQGNVIKDPGIEFGPFRVLRRSDGQLAICDTRRPPGFQTVALRDGLDEASKEAERLSKLPELTLLEGGGVTPMSSTDAYVNKELSTGGRR